MTFKNFLDRVEHSFVKICGFAICGFIIKICGFAICGLAHLRKLRICDSVISPRIWGFTICGLSTKVCLPTSVHM